MAPNGRSERHLSTARAPTLRGRTLYNKGTLALRENSGLAVQLSVITSDLTTTTDFLSPNLSPHGIPYYMLQVPFLVGDVIPRRDDSAGTPRSLEAVLEICPMKGPDIYSYALLAHAPTPSAPRKPRAYTRRFQSRSKAPRQCLLRNSRFSLHEYASLLVPLDLRWICRWCPEFKVKKPARPKRVDAPTLVLESSPP